MRKSKIEIKKRWLNPNILIADFNMAEEGGGNYQFNIETGPQETKLVPTL